MTEEERKALKVGDKIRALEDYGHTWFKGKEYTIETIDSHRNPCFEKGVRRISKDGKNIKRFEVVKPWTKCPGKYRWCKECDVREGDGTGTCGYLHQGCACQECNAHPSTCKGIPSAGIEMLSAPSPEAQGLRALEKGEKVIVLPGSISAASVGEVLEFNLLVGDPDLCNCTSKDKAPLDHNTRTLARKHLLVVGDLVYKKSMVGKIIAIHDSGHLDTRWKPEDTAIREVRHNILKDGKLQWHHAPEGVGWGEKLNSKNIVVGVAGEDLEAGDPIAIDAEGKVARANGRPECFGKRGQECSGTCTSCVHSKGGGTTPCECYPGRDHSCSFVKGCSDSETTQSSTKPECFGDPDCPDIPCDDCGRRQGKSQCQCNEFACKHGKDCYGIETEHSNYEPITEEEHIMATETFRRLERAKEIEMIELPRAEHEVKAAEEKKVLLKEEMDRLKTHPTELAEKEFLLINLVGKDKARETLRAIELGLPIDINIENVSSKKSMKETSDPIQDLAK